MTDITRDAEISHPRRVRPHLVFLGAGASRAAFPAGDVGGRLLPVMQDLTSILGLEAALGEHGVSASLGNFEQVFSFIAARPNLAELRADIERRVAEYFSRLALPDQPTLYDQLLLSLRGKDMIATFNWDPFLVQAYRRNRPKVPSLPHLRFLHGNVLSAFCETDSLFGTPGMPCPRCGAPLAPTPLLYPVEDKCYSTHPAIAAAWDDVRTMMKEALVLTIFGYSAPATDADAIELLSTAWGTPNSRQFEQVDIIDIQPEADLIRTWSKFIHTHHYSVAPAFEGSFISQHPRRTIEAFISETIEARLIEVNPLPRACSLHELWAWFEPLAKAEASPHAA